MYACMVYKDSVGHAVVLKWCCKHEQKTELSLKTDKKRKNRTNHDFCLQARPSKTGPPGGSRNRLHHMEGTMGRLHHPIGTWKRAPRQASQSPHSVFFHETFTIHVVDNLSLSNEQRNKVILRYVEGHTNESVERRNFWRHVQHTGESFDN